MDGSHITQTPGVMGGKPCIAGTRLTVAHVLENLAGGMSVDEYVAEYPTAHEAGVRAALAYAAAYFHHSASSFSGVNNREIRD